MGIDRRGTLWHLVSMNRHHVTLSKPLSEAIRTQVSSGRFKDFSAALQEAAWNYFVGPPCPFEEYKVSPDEVEDSARKDLAEISRLRRAGQLKPVKL
jgi:hypothetical protein